MSPLEEFKNPICGFRDWFFTYVDEDDAREILAHRAHCNIYGLRNKDEIYEFYRVFREEIEMTVLEEDQIDIWEFWRRCGAQSFEELITELVWTTVERNIEGCQDILHDMARQRG